MEQHLERLMKFQKSKAELNNRRGMELNNLRPNQASQELKPLVVPGLNGGAMGLQRVVGGRLRKRGGAYLDHQFGQINEPMAESPEEAVGVAPGTVKVEGSGRRKPMKKKGGLMDMDMEMPMKKKGGVIVVEMPIMVKKPMNKKVSMKVAPAMSEGKMRMKARGDAVRRIMKEKGMSLPEASKYLKAHPEQM
jgi:hypothetical protein